MSDLGTGPVTGCCSRASDIHLLAGSPSREAGNRLFPGSLTLEAGSHLCLGSLSRDPTGSHPDATGKGRTMSVVGLV